MWTCDPSKPFDELFARFLVEVHSEIDADTLKLWKIYDRAHFQPFFKTLEAFTLAGCASYGRARLNNVKRATVQKELSVLRRFGAWCEEQGYCDAAPEVPNVRRRATGTPFHKRRRGKATELDVTEVRKLIDALPEWSESKKTKRFPVRARFIVAFETGLRPATLNVLSVPEHYTRNAAELVIPDEDDKARFGRVLPLSPEARAALASVLPKKGVVFGKHDYRPQLTKAAADTLSADKAKTFTAYDLRHARLTQLAEAGNLTGAAYLAGHRRVSTTDKYVKPNRRAAERALAGIGATGFRPPRANPATARRSANGVAKSASSLALCEGGDLNPYGSYPTSTSS